MKDGLTQDAWHGNAVLGRHRRETQICRFTRLDLYFAEKKERLPGKMDHGSC
jgi:hypothetical protein